MSDEKPEAVSEGIIGQSASTAGLGVSVTKRPITPAMREWLRRLARPRMCEWVKNRPEQLGVYGRGAGSFGSPTYVMAERMLDAGLIRYEPRDIDGRRTEHVAVLTESGRAYVTPNVEVRGASASARL